MLMGHRYSLFCIFCHPRALPQSFWPGRPLTTVMIFCLTTAGWVCLIASWCCSALEPTSGSRWDSPTSTGSRWQIKDVTLADPMYFDLGWLFLSRKREHTTPFLSYFRSGRSARKSFCHFCAFTFLQALAEVLHTKESHFESQFSLLRQVSAAHTSTSHIMR